MTARVAISGASRRRSPVTAAPATRQETSTTAAPKLRYIVVTLAGIFAILGGQLLLSISSPGAYEIASLKGEMRQSEQSLQIVAEEIGALTAPDTLASLAGSMGMVEDNNPAYLRVSDGAVLGEAAPAAEAGQGQIYTVTAGTEAFVPVQIVTDVFASLSAQAAYELSAEDALRAAHVPVVESGEAAIHTAMVTPALFPWPPSVALFLRRLRARQSS